MPGRLGRRPERTLVLFAAGLLLGIGACRKPDDAASSRRDAAVAATMPAPASVRPEDRAQARRLVAAGNEHFLGARELDAHRAYAEAARLDPDDREAVERAAETARLVRRFDVAKGYLDALVARFPDEPKTYVQAAFNAYDAGDFAACLDYLGRADRVLDKDPEVRDDPELWFMRGVAARRRFQTPDAAKALERAVRLRPTNADYHDYLGRVLLFDTRYEAAESAFREVLKLSPKNAWAHYHIGWSALRRGAAATAVASLERAIALDGGNWEWHLQLARAYEALGSQDALKKALDLADQALALNRRAHEVLHFKALVLRKVGRIEESERYLERHTAAAAFLQQSDDELRSLLRAIEQKPEEEAPYLAMIERSLQSGHADDAQDLVDRLLIAAPRSVEGIAQSFRLAFSRGDLRAAEWEARKLIDYAPADSRGHSYLASVETRRGEAAAALAGAETAYALNRDDFTALQIMMHYYTKSPERSADAQRLHSRFVELGAERAREAEAAKTKREAFDARMMGEPENE